MSRPEDRSAAYRRRPWWRRYTIQSYRLWKLAYRFRLTKESVVRTERRWLDLTAEYTDAEDAAMAELKLAGCVRELEVIHLLKALCDARIVLPN